MIAVVVKRLDVAWETVRALSGWLSGPERQRAQRFRFERDRRRFIVARARLREELGLRLGVPPAEVGLGYGPRGKPCLLDDEQWRFNVSHCDELAVLAFARGREVGVDVEAVRPLDDADALAARFFSPREYQDYAALDPAERPAGFFNCWTRKEAFVKALGDGLYLPPDRFDVSLAPGWQVENFSPACGFVAALVAEG